MNAFPIRPFCSSRLVSAELYFDMGNFSITKAGIAGALGVQEHEWI